LQAWVEVSLDGEPSDAKSIEKAVETELKALGKSVEDKVKELIDTLHKLQKEEAQGNQKASTEAEKQFKETEKFVKKWADTFGVQVRKAVQEEYATQTKAKEQLRSASRTNFRGMELKDEAFKNAAERAEPPAYVGELAKSLAALGKEIHKLSEQEKNTRRDLGLEIERVQQLVEKARAGKKEFDIGEFLKANSKDGRALEQNAGKYAEFLISVKEKLDEAEDKCSKLDKLVDKDKKLGEDKSLGKLIDAYAAKLKTVDGTLPDKKTAAEQAKRLFKADYGDGNGWKALIADLAKFPGAAKSAGFMKDLGADLEKALKS
jgi:vacuolar-type H+-ATPase subunit I/STV1